MANRPKEYGDQTPSDIGDVVPGDPIAGFQERDYSIAQSSGKPRKVETPRDFFPDLGVPNPEPVERDSWHGIILSVQNNLGSYPRQYKVIKQDGEIVIADCLQVLNYEEFKPGHDVMLSRGQTQGHYTIIGKTRPKELQAVTLYNSISREGSQAFVVPFDTYHLAVPISDHFSDKPKPALAAFNGRKIHGVGVPGIIQVDEPSEAVYDISFNVCLSLQGAGVNEAQSSYFQTGCWKHEDLEDKTLAEKPVKSPKLWFHEQNGFRIYYDPCDCTANVALRAGKPDMIMNQQFPKKSDGSTDFNKVAEWTDEPKIGNNIQVGTQVHQGWVKIGSEDQYVWLSHGGGGGKSKIKFPPNPPCGPSPDEVSTIKPFAGFLQAVAVSGECVKLGWKRPGKSGSLKVLSCDIASWNYCYIYRDWIDDVPDTTGPYQVCATPVHECYTVRFDCGFFAGANAGDDSQTSHGQSCGNPQKHVCCVKNPDFFDPCEFHWEGGDLTAGPDPNPNEVICEPLVGCPDYRFIDP